MKASEAFREAQTIEQCRSKKKFLNETKKTKIKKFYQESIESVIDGMVEIVNKHREFNINTKWIPIPVPQKYLGDSLYNKLLYSKLKSLGYTVKFKIDFSLMQWPKRVFIKDPDVKSCCIF
jgi:hypothetical protein